MSEPAWLVEARKWIGTKEVKGTSHNPVILQFWRDAALSIRDDETPWCSAFACACLERVGVQSPRNASSKSFASWGMSLEKPALGAIVVFSRAGGGHVGFVVGVEGDRLMVLGGNQSDQVKISAFKMNSPSMKVLGFRWPKGQAMPSNGGLSGGVASSTPDWSGQSNRKILKTWFNGKLVGEGLKKLS